MARKSRQQGAGEQSTTTEKILPVTSMTGVNAAGTKSVLVSAVLEVNGQVRFGDGTDVGLTVTEADTVLHPTNGAQVQKFIFAGSKRRGVDRRTIHELRDRHWDGGKCYIPELCCECPICWLYGFTGTTQKKDINAKSRVLYASSVSVEGTQIGVNTHSRNQVDEKTQTTAGSAGIHEEQIIVAGVHFPIHTALVHVLDWEIGVFAHALLENVNGNRYTAASRAQGGIRFTEQSEEPLVIVDESEQGIFPLAAPKIPGWESGWQEASKLFQDAMNSQELKGALEKQGFKVTVKTKDSDKNPMNTDSEERPQPTSDSPASSETAKPELILDESEPGIIAVKQGDQALMVRYVGSKAVGYLRQKQLAARQLIADLNASDFRTEISSYVAAITKKGGGADTQIAPDAAIPGDDGNDSGS
jgi:hypothetical protein